jgi:hypothetical protein
VKFYPDTDKVCCRTIHRSATTRICNVKIYPYIGTAAVNRIPVAAHIKACLTPNISPLHNPFLPLPRPRTQLQSFLIAKFQEHGWFILEKDHPSILHLRSEISMKFMNEYRMSFTEYLTHRSHNPPPPLPSVHHCHSGDK